MALKKSMFSKCVLQALTSRKLQICAELFCPWKPCHEVISEVLTADTKRPWCCLCKIWLSFPLVFTAPSWIPNNLVDPMYQWNIGGFAHVSWSLAHLPGTTQLWVLPHSWFAYLNVTDKATCGQKMCVHFYHWPKERIINTKIWKKLNPEICAYYVFCSTLPDFVLILPKTAVLDCSKWLISLCKNKQIVLSIYGWM